MMCGYKNTHFLRTSVVFLVLHLILVVKQQNRVLEGHCCHPIFNSPLCVKITISLKWTNTALLSMIAQVFLLNQFIILQLILCKGCSPRCKLGSWWWLSHIPFLLLFAVGKRMNEWEKVLFHPLFWSLYVHGKPHQEISCLSQPRLSILSSATLHACRIWLQVMISECCYTKVCSHPSLFPRSSKARQWHSTPFCLIFFFLIHFDFKHNYSL